MIPHRRIERGRDDQAILDFHVEIIFGSESAWAQVGGYAAYCRKWLSTAQPVSFLSDLYASQSDLRTVGEIWEESGLAVGYVWATFHEVPEYGFSFVEVRDIAVAPSHRHQGLGMAIMDYVERHAVACGAKALRSEVGTGNAASQGLHLKAGYQPYRTLMEKVLNPESGPES